MTPSQLAAIRKRLDAATPGPWELWYGELDWVSVGIDGDTVAECRTHINHQFSGWQNLRNATFIQHAPTDLRALLDEVERLTHNLVQTEQHAQILEGSVKRLTDWQVAIADGLGFLNRAEGRGGYEVAEPETIIGAWREQEREVERLCVERDDLLAWSQRFSDLVGVDGSTEAGRDEAFAKLYDAAKASGKLVKE